MHISLTSRTVVLHADTAAVTGGTLIDGISVFLKNMPIDKALLGGLGPADMTGGTTVGMTGRAMVGAGLIDLVPQSHVSPGLQYCLKGRKGCVQ
jgi:hypothetical protein